MSLEGARGNSFSKSLDLKAQCDAKQITFIVLNAFA